MKKQAAEKSRALSGVERARAGGFAKLVAGTVGELLRNFHQPQVGDRSATAPRHRR